MGEPPLFENSLLTFSRKPRNCPDIWGCLGVGGSQTCKPQLCRTAEKAANRNPDGRSVEMLRELGKSWLWIWEGQSRPERGFARYRTQQLSGGGGPWGQGLKCTLCFCFLA